MDNVDRTMTNGDLTCPWTVKNWDSTINKVTPPVKTRAVLQSGISDVLQDMWHFWMPFHECSYFILLCAWVCIMTHTHTDIYMCVCLWVRTISCLCAALCMSKKMTLITAALDAHHPSPQPQRMSRNAFQGTLTSPHPPHPNPSVCHVTIPRNVNITPPPPPQPQRMSRNASKER